ncbi:MAG: PEGA domain-containing protein [Ignavibacteriaceae bacterium]
MTNKRSINILSIICISISIIVNSGCDKEVSRTPVEPPPPEGFIHVESEPPGFTIYQNDRNTGRHTPDSLSYLEKGDYKITLKKLYWKDTSVVISIDEEDIVNVNINYLPNESMYGDLTIFSVPEGAQIFLNDSLLSNTTAYTLENLLPGLYNIRLKLFDHRDEEFAATVQSSMRKIYSSVLRDTSVWVDFQVFNSGIQSNLLTDITIDPNGVKWIGSLNMGLISYNDIEFKNFNKTNSALPGNKINCISVDVNNKIWIGTDFGLAIFDNNDWIVYNNTNSGLTSNIINSVNFDQSGNAWIGTSSGLVKFDGLTWKIFNDSQLRVWAMDSQFDNQGVNWIGTREEGVVSLEDDSLIFYPKSIYNYPTNRISSIVKDANGNIWFSHMPDSAEASGVSYWYGNIFTKFLLGTPNNNINNIFIDPENNKWISSWEGFIWFDDGNSSRTLTTFNSLISSNQTNGSVRDQNGVVWITTNGGGLNKFKVKNLD